MIQVSNLTRYYGALPALRNVSFSVEKGEIVGLLGLNGAGKTTALKILAGILSPSEGSVTMEGKSVTDSSDALKSRIGFLPEEPPLYRDMTVTGFLVYVAQLKGMSRQDALARLPEIVRNTGLLGRENQIIGTLSHGYKKRVGIAMAVIHNPAVIILDEPISGLDPRQIKDMRGVIRRLAEDRAVLISSHILSEVSKTCDRLVVLDQGRMVAQGTQAELTRHMEGTRINLTVRGEKDSYHEWLHNHPRVLGYSNLPASEGLVSTTIKLDGDYREEVVADAVKAGFGVRLVEEPEYDLEEVFLRFTGGPAPLQVGEISTLSDFDTEAPTEEVDV